MSRVGNLEGIAEVLKECRFGELKFLVRMDGQRPYLQLVADEMDPHTGQPKQWQGRKWLLSFHMTRSELVQTLFKAVLTFIEHEVREQFTYRGVAIFDPHYDVEKLVLLRAQQDALDVRSLDKYTQRRAA